MNSPTVVSLRGFIAYVDTYVDVMPGVQISVSLPFGPFPSTLVARGWADGLEAIFAATHTFESASAVLIEEDGARVKPYLDVHITVKEIIENLHARRLKGTLFSPEDVSVVGEKLAGYAIAAVSEVLLFSLALMQIK